MDTVSGLKQPKSRLAILDLIAHVVLAAGIGLATSIALAGVVILLAEETDSASAQEMRLARDATRAAVDRNPLPGMLSERGTK